MAGMIRRRGFTLVELVVVIAIAGILSMAMLQFITAPVSAYVSQSRRAALVDIAEMALGRIAYDVRHALPNSIRVGCGGQCLEMLRAAGGGRYRAAPNGDPLSFIPTDLDTNFDVLGPLSNPGGLSTGGLASDCTDGAAACVVIYNTGQTGTDAWNADNIATLTAINTIIGPPAVTQISFNNLGFSGGQTAFPAASPDQRFFLVDTAIGVICDPAAGTGTLHRAEGYGIHASHADVDTLAELTALSNPAEYAMLADRVSACDFDYDPGSPGRDGVLTVSLTVAEAGEQITLLQQIHVSNQP
jgi:MSHA biogenesis protein MshO